MITFGEVYFGIKCKITNFALAKITTETIKQAQSQAIDYATRQQPPRRQAGTYIKIRPWRENPAPGQ